MKAGPLFFPAVLMLGACSGNSNQTKDVSQDTLVVTESIAAVEPDSVPVDTVPAKLEPEKPVDTHYEGSILNAIRKASPDYASRLRREGGNGFIVVDKASMRVLLYDSAGIELKAYDMACAKNYGHKQRKRDSRTPEGYFHVQGIFDSTDWLFTDDDGHTSKKKGQFGPRFIRIAPQIGIHGTCSPWSIGHRASHGCIRITNENILELVQLVKPDMPVIVIPGKRDREVNRNEGHASVYFPTAPKYAISEKERNLADTLPVQEESRDTLKTDSVIVVDSVSANVVPVPEAVEVDTLSAD